MKAVEETTLGATHSALAGLNLKMAVRRTAHARHYATPNYAHEYPVNALKG